MTANTPVPAATTAEETKSSSSSIFKVVAIVVALVALGLVSATFVLTPEAQTVEPAKNVDIIQVTPLIPTPAANDEKSQSHSHSDCSSHKEVPVVPEQPKSALQAIFSSRRNVIIICVVAALVVLAVAASIAAVIMMNRADAARIALEEQPIATDPASVGVQNISPIKEFFETRGALAIAASIGFIVLFAVIIGVIVTIMCSRKVRTASGFVKCLGTNKIALIVVAILWIALALTVVLGRLYFPEVVLNAVLIGLYTALSFLGFLASFVGGPVTFAIVAVILSIALFATIIGSCFFRNGRKIDEGEYRGEDDYSMRQRVQYRLMTCADVSKPWEFVLKSLFVIASIIGTIVVAFLYPLFGLIGVGVLFISIVVFFSNAIISKCSKPQAGGKKPDQLFDEDELHDRDQPHDRDHQEEPIDPAPAPASLEKVSTYLKFKLPCFRQHKNDE